jgi:radical SAM-linked protein
MRLVAKFSKEDRLKYISHLDMMRTFQRAIRRAALPVAFTQGFSPHPKMAFASALSVGLTSEGEYLDIVMEKDISVEEFGTILNAVLPSGLKIVQSARIDPKHPSLMSLIERAAYRIFLPVSVKEFIEGIEAFLNQPYVLVIGEKSGSTQHINIRPSIHWAKPSIDDRLGQAVDVMLNSGSRSNLKPQLFTKALLNYFETDSEQLNCKIHRLDMFFQKNGDFVTPLALDEVISI